MKTEFLEACVHTSHGAMKKKKKKKASSNPTHMATIHRNTRQTCHTLTKHVLYNTHHCTRQNVNTYPARHHTQETASKLATSTSLSPDKNVERHSSAIVTAWLVKHNHSRHRHSDMTCNKHTFYQSQLDMKSLTTMHDAYTHTCTPHAHTPQACTHT